MTNSSPSRGTRTPSVRAAISSAHLSHYCTWARSASVPACSPRARSASTSSSTWNSSNGTVHLPSVAQPSETTPHVALDGAERQVEAGRDLVVREVLVEREPQDGPLRVAEAGQLVSDDHTVDHP